MRSLEGHSFCKVSEGFLIPCSITLQQSTIFSLPLSLHSKYCVDYNYGGSCIFYVVFFCIIFIFIFFLIKGFVVKNKTKKTYVVEQCNGYKLEWKAGEVWKVTTHTNKKIASLLSFAFLFISHNRNQTYLFILFFQATH